MKEEALSRVGPQSHKKKSILVLSRDLHVSSVEAFVSIGFYENLYECDACESYVNLWPWNWTFK